MPWAVSWVTWPHHWLSSAQWLGGACPSGRGCPAEGPHMPGCVAISRAWQTWLRGTIAVSGGEQLRVQLRWDPD